MATKKSTTKKPATKKKATAKAKAAPSTSLGGLRSQVALRPEDQPFMTFKLTKQTLYWLVLGAVVVLFALWITKLQADVQAIYDEIDRNTSSILLR